MKKGCGELLLAALLLGALGAQGQPVRSRDAALAPTKEGVSARGRGSSGPRTASAPSAAARRVRRVTPQSGPGPSVGLLGSVATASPAESVALNGNLAYVCDDNEISFVDITDPANPQIVGMSTASVLLNADDIRCAVQRNTLTVFPDRSSTLGNTPAYLAYDLSNPSQPQLINDATPLTKRFGGDPVYIGNFAFVPTAAFAVFLGISVGYKQR
jgi:hypothetical protein